MTVSFFIHGIQFETGRELACPACGVTGHDAAGKPAELLEYCPACGGYGGVMVEPSPFVLTVSELVADQILKSLRLGVQVGISGSTSPDWILKHKPTGPVIASSYWLPRLTRIARKAQKYRRWVVWQQNGR